MIKVNELNDPQSCLSKSADDEMLFVLRAQDETAPLVIQYWLSLNPQLGSAKRLEAEECMKQMQQWQTRKKPD